MHWLSPWAEQVQRMLFDKEEISKLEVECFKKDVEVMRMKIDGAWQPTVV